MNEIYSNCRFIGIWRWSEKGKAFALICAEISCVHAQDIDQVAAVPFSDTWLVLTPHFTIHMFKLFTRWLRLKNKRHAVDCHFSRIRAQIGRIHSCSELCCSDFFMGYWTTIIYQYISTNTYIQNIYTCACFSLI